MKHPCLSNISTRFDVFLKNIYIPPSEIFKTQRRIRMNLTFTYKNWNLLIMECKAINMNGTICDRGDYNEMTRKSLKISLSLKFAT